MTSALRRLSFAAMFFTSASSASLGAQTPGTGAIQGSVADPAGLPVAHGHVRLVDNATHLTRNAETDAKGLFHAALLVPGTYTVTVTEQGFADRTSSAVPVHVDETTVLSITLAVASAGESVDVRATPDLLQTDSATLGRSVDSKAILALPLANRNFTQILSLSPGVLVSLPDATQLGRGSQNVAADGNKTTANNIQFNGIDANNLAQNSASNAEEEVGVAVPAPDTIQEFKVQTANYDAGYGRGTGANVDLVSKAGTNSLHGSAWEFLRNDIFNANLFYRKADGLFSRPVLKQNQFGVAVGGPLYRDKAFFFFAYQGVRSSNGLGDSVTTLLPALGSDRSAAKVGAQFCGSGPTFAGGTQVACDGSNINPVALALLNAKLPNGAFAVPSPQALLPVVAGQTPIGQSTFSIPANYREDQYTVNLDQTLSEKDQVMERFFYAKSPTATPFAPNAANVPGWSNTEVDENVLAVIGETHVFNSSFVNVARAGFTRFYGDSSVAQPLSSTDIGSQSPVGSSGKTIPMPSVFVNGLFTVGDGGTPFLKGVTNSFIVQDTASLIRGRHSLRAGLEGKHHEVMVEPPFVSDGAMFMETFNDFLIGQSAAQNGSPSGLGNIWLTAAASGIFRKDQRYNDFAAFLQDDFRISPRLSLFTGLRYEIFGSPTEAHERFATFDPSIATSNVPVGGSLSGFVVPSGFSSTLPSGVKRMDRNGFWPNHFGDLSPRVGFSLRPWDRAQILLRGGYGVYFDRLSAGLLENLVGQSPFAEDQTLFFGQTAASSEQQPFAPLLPQSSSFPTFISRQQGGAQTISAVDPDTVDPFTQEYNLNIQAAIAYDFLLEVGYVGTHASHIPGGVEFNQALLASPQSPINGETTNTAANITNRLPYAGIATGSLLYQTRFHSNYNSLQTSLTHRLGHGLQLLASYTWSKGLDETSGTNGSGVYEEWLLSNDQRNPRQAYGPTDFDRRHRGVLSLVYQAPHQFAAPRVAALGLRDWVFSTIAVAQSGSALTITDGNAGAVYGNFENRAAKPTGNPLTTGSMRERATGSYLDASVFPSAPIAPFGLSSTDTDFGNSSTGFLVGPSQRNIDFALERTFPIHRSLGFLFRTEFFNATNTPNFANPNTNVSSGASFGRISATANNPRIVQFAAKVLF